jgi:hypothetical protein
MNMQEINNKSLFLSKLEAAMLNEVLSASHYHLTILSITMNNSDFNIRQE